MIKDDLLQNSGNFVIYYSEYASSMKPMGASRASRPNSVVDLASNKVFLSKPLYAELESVVPEFAPDDIEISQSFLS